MTDAQRAAMKQAISTLEAMGAIFNSTLGDDSIAALRAQLDAPVAPEGFLLVNRSKLEAAHIQAKLAEQCIVDYANAGIGQMFGYLDDSCCAAGIAASLCGDMLSIAPINKDGENNG